MNVVPITDYYFVTKEQMLKDISENKFIEYVENYGNLYGTRSARRD